MIGRAAMCTPHTKRYDLLPEQEDRNGRHWMRVELGTIMMEFAFEISVQLWSRRDSSGMPPL